MGMTKTILMRMLLAVALALAAAQPAAAGKMFRIYGDLMSYALPAAAAAATLALGDAEGLYQFTTVLTASVGATAALKSAIGRERPDGSDHRSMPSGHATRAFAAAAFIHQRYGLLPSLPAYVLAWSVGVSRVDADAHHWSDVIAAAALTWAVAAAIA